MTHTVIHKLNNAKLQTIRPNEAVLVSCGLGVFLNIYIVTIR